MAEEGNTYVTVWENVRRYDNELKEAFKKIAGADGEITSANVPDVLNDMSVTLAFDCEEAKYFISQENKEIATSYNLNALKYDKFIELFGLWLQSKAKTDGKTIPNVKPGQQTGQQNDVKVTKAPTVNPKYPQNKKLLDELLEKHRDEYETIFKDRLFEEGQTQIAVQDYFVFLQDCFDQDEIDLKGRDDDKEDFFRTINSYKKLFKLADRYFAEENKKPNADDLIMLSFDDCFKLLDYCLRTDESLVLVDKRDTTKVGAAKRILLVTIANYERLINDTTNEIEKAVLIDTVESLKEKLKELEKGLNPKDIPKQEKDKNDPEEIKRKEEKRNRALREIFYFYCTQQYSIGRTATFEKLDRLASTITIGTFRVFLKNFRLKIDNRKLIELYNKSAGNDENMTYDEFYDLLVKVALRAETVPEPKSHQPKPEIMKDYKPTSYKEDNTYKIFKQNEPKRIEEVINSRKGKTDYHDEIKRDAEKLEEIWEHMGIFNDAYKNLTGWVHLPFNSQEKKDFRMPLAFDNYKPKEMQGKTHHEIQEDVQKRNDQRKFVKDLHNLEHGLLSHFRGSSSPVRPVPPTYPREDSYVNLQTNKAKMAIVVPKKLTMRKIEKFQQGEFVRLEESFNPHDLIDENDDEDNLYLAEYKLHADKKQRKTPVEVQKRKLEEYGKLKKARGFAVNGKYGSQSPRPGDSKHYGSDSDLPSYDSKSRHPNANHSNASPIKGSHVSPKHTKLSQMMSLPSYLDYESTASVQSMSVKNHHVNRSGNISPANGYGYQDNSYIKSKQSNYNSTLDRASQIEYDSRKREQQMMNNIMSIQSTQVRRGLKAVGK